MFIYSTDKHGFPYAKSQNRVGVYKNTDAVLRFIPHARNFSPKEINFDIFLYQFTKLRFLIRTDSLLYPKNRRNEPTLVHQCSQLVNEESRNKAYQGINQVMRLNVHRSTAQQNIKRSQYVS